MSTGFRLCTVLWGDWHVNAFLRYSLPTLLAPNNIPALAARKKGDYTIITSSADAAAIDTSPALASLRRHVGVQLIARERDAFDGNFAGIHDHGWRITAEHARNANQWIAFVAPDVCWSDGALGVIAEAFEQEKVAVFLFHHRVAFETFPNDLDEFRRSHSEIIVSAGDLAGLALRHLSPLVCSYFRESRHLPHHAEYVYFPVPGEGVVLRSIVTPPWAYDPTQVSFGDKPTSISISSREQLEFLTDSGRFVNVSLTPTRHQADWYFEQRRLDVLAEGLIANQFYGYAVEHLWRVPFFLHAGHMTSAKWQRVTRESDTHMAKAYVALKTTRILMDAHREGCQEAARVIAAAMALKALRNFPRGPRLSVLLPSNQALQSDPQAALCSKENRRRLGELLMRHVLLGDLSHSHSSSIQDAAGRSVPVSRNPSIVVGEARVLRELRGTPLPGNAVQLYEIDRLMP